MASASTGTRRSEDCQATEKAERRVVSTTHGIKPLHVVLVAEEKAERRGHGLLADVLGEVGVSAGEGETRVSTGAARPPV